MTTRTITERQEKLDRCCRESSKEPKPFILPPEKERENLLETACICAPMFHEGQSEEEEEIDPACLLPQLPQALLSQTNASSSITSTVPVMPQEVQMLFEKMASHMILQTSSGNSETQIHLDAPQFSSSLFYGTTITIKEYQTAPKIFNIEIASRSQALSLLDTHKGSLMHAFQIHDFNFSVQRLDLCLNEEESPLFHRKEEIGRDQEDATS